MMNYVKLLSFQPVESLDGYMDLFDTEPGDASPGSCSRMRNEGVAAHVQDGDHQSLRRRRWGRGQLQYSIGHGFEHLRRNSAFDRLVVHPRRVQLPARHCSLLVRSQVEDQLVESDRSIVRQRGSRMKGVDMRRQSFLAFYAPRPVICDGSG